MNGWIIALAVLLAVAVAVAVAVALLSFIRKKTVHRGPTPIPPSTVREYFQQPPVALSKEFERLGKLAYGLVGACAIHVESGREATYNGDVPMPMASVFKVPLAVVLLSRVDSGALDPTTMLDVQAADLCPGGGLLQMAFKPPRISLPMLSLIELMLVISDNTASEVLLRLAGGPDSVEEQIRQFGIRGMRFDRSTAQLIADFYADAGRFAKDRRDTATAEAVTRLLTNVFLGHALRQPTAQILLDAMYRCQTGPSRIPGMLPPGTKVAHKTGTLNFIVNDTGIITLPDESHVAITILSVCARATTEPERERTIAEMARAAYDYFALC